MITVYWHPVRKAKQQQCSKREMVPPKTPRNPCSCGGQPLKHKGDSNGDERARQHRFCNMQHTLHESRTACHPFDALSSLRPLRSSLETHRGALVACPRGPSQRKTTSAVTAAYGCKKKKTAYSGGRSQQQRTLRERTQSWPARPSFRGVGRARRRR